jgi:multidrug efflux pump subunit AcrA (membrane-fusion protein)
MAKQSSSETKPQVSLGLIIGLVVLLIVGGIVWFVNAAPAKDPTLTAAPPIVGPTPNAVGDASPELLDTKRREAGEPTGGAPRKPAQPYTP